VGGSKWICALVVVAAASLLAPTALAGDFGSPPTARLHVLDETQRAHAYSAFWFDPDIDCYVRDGFHDYPHAIRVPTESTRARIVFRVAEQPTSVTVYDYPRIERTGDVFSPEDPAGPPRVTDAEIEPKLAGGELVAWRAIFRIRGSRDHFVEVGAEWPAPSGCGRSAAYVFHARGVE
jgi:hypothetical protein